MTERRRRWALAWTVCVMLAAVPVRGHDGPPFPIVSNHAAGPYRISVWTDPDATDDGSLGGQFWVMIDMADGTELPADLRARVSIRPLSRPDPPSSGEAEPVASDRSRRFVALLMDHEGPFAVHVLVEGATGPAKADARVDATYDLRPPPIMLVVYAVPFVLVGVLWTTLLVRRRRASVRLAR